MSDLAPLSDLERLLREALSYGARRAPDGWLLLPRLRALHRRQRRRCATCILGATVVAVVLVSGMTLTHWTSG